MRHVMKMCLLENTKQNEFMQKLYFKLTSHFIKSIIYVIVVVVAANIVI